MTNEELRNIIEIDTFYKISTKSDTFVGLVDGPYRGYLKALNKSHQKDYLYIKLINNQGQTIHVYSEDVISIEILNLK